MALLNAHTGALGNYCGSSCSSSQKPWEEVLVGGGPGGQVAALGIGELTSWPEVFRVAQVI